MYCVLTVFINISKLVYIFPTTTSSELACDVSNISECATCKPTLTLVEINVDNVSPCT